MGIQASKNRATTIPARFNSITMCIASPLLYGLPLPVLSVHTQIWLKSKTYFDLLVNQAVYQSRGKKIRFLIQKS
jgi:hypothetical protein